MKQPVFYWAYLCLYISVLLFNLRLKKKEERWAPCLTHYFRSRKPTAHNPQLLNDRRGDFNRTKRLKKINNHHSQSVWATDEMRHLDLVSSQPSLHVSQTHSAAWIIHSQHEALVPGPARTVASHPRRRLHPRALTQQITAADTQRYIFTSQPQQQVGDDLLSSSPLWVFLTPAAAAAAARCRPPPPPGTAGLEPHDPSPPKNEGAQVEKTSRAQPRQEDEADGGRSAGLWL